jgi:hypothetical protein
VRSPKANLAQRLIIVAALSLANVSVVTNAQTRVRPPHGLTVLLPHLYRPDFTDCMGRAVFLGVGPKGVSILTEPGQRFSDQRLTVIADRIAQIMASRVERIVYVVGDRKVSYGDVTTLIAELQRTTSELNVVLVSQADLIGLRSGLCLGVQIK